MVEFGFYALSLVAVGMLISLFKSYSKKKIALSLFAGGSLWIFYLIILTQTGVLRNFELPPRVPLLIVFPALAILLVSVNSKFMSKSLERTPAHLPILLQSFRILVELLIYSTYLKGIFPQRATFEGLNFDILVGITALFMGWAVYHGKIKREGILTWNIVSLCVLLLTVYSFISSFYFTDFISSKEALQFVEFPYLLLASVLLPIAIFLHAFSIKQVLRKKGRND